MGVSCDKTFFGMVGVAVQSAGTVGDIVRQGLVGRVVWLGMLGVAKKSYMVVQRGQVGHVVGISDCRLELYYFNCNIIMNTIC